MSRSLVLRVGALSLALILAMIAVLAWAGSASAPAEVIGAPPQPAAPAPATIRGMISYSGAVTGTHFVWVGAFTTLGEPPTYATRLFGVGPYTLTVQAGTYYLYAGMDADDSGGDPNPAIDPLGAYGGNPLDLSAGQVISDVDIALVDPYQPPPGATMIRGTISYSGMYTGTHIAWVGAFTGTLGGPPAFSTQLFGVGPYTLTVEAGSYYLYAGMDGDNSGGPPDPTKDPMGEYANNPVVIAAGETISDVDIVLLDPHQPPPGGSISGVVSYSGRIQPPRRVIVIASRPEDQEPAYHAILPGPGPYTMTQVAGGDYYVAAFMDVGEDMGPPEPGEPFAYYDLGGDGPDLVHVGEGSAVTGIDILLRDPLRYIYLPLALKR
jgi:hypothetical protein